MKDTEFKPEEIDMLCQLYLDGQLSRQEEVSLRCLLLSQGHLSQLGQLVLRLMIAERQFALSVKKKNPGKIWWSVGVVASVALLISVGCFYLIPRQVDDSDQTYVVWVDGQKIVGDEARIIAEKSQREDMEMFRNLMARHRDFIDEDFRNGITANI